MTAPLFSLQGISFNYPGHPVLEQVDFDLHPGERVALVGTNGAGKSTLLRLMVGLHRSSQGTLNAFGFQPQDEKTFREVRLRAGMLFQDPDDQLFCPTVLEDVTFGPLNQGKSMDEAMEIADGVLTTLGLKGFEQRITYRLSGGEKRLVSLATVLAMEPEVLLLDEPSNGLDDDTQERLLEHLKALPQAMVFVSHDRTFVEQLASRAVLLQDGKLSDAVLHSHPHSHTHSHLHIHAPGVHTGHQHGEKTPEHGDHDHQ